MDACGGVCEGTRQRAREKRERERDWKSGRECTIMPMETNIARYPILGCGLIKNCGHVRDMVDF